MSDLNRIEHILLSSLTWLGKDSYITAESAELHYFVSPSVNPANIYKGDMCYFISFGCGIVIFLW